MAVVCIVKGKDLLCGGIDKTGKEVIPLKYKIVKRHNDYFEDGMAIVEYDGKWGLLFAPQKN